MAVYRHSSGCPELVGDLCICEPRRYLGSGLIAASVASALFIAAAIGDSKTLAADALHLLGDGAFDFVTLLIALLALRSSAYEKLYRVYGGYVQALLLGAAGLLILAELVSKGGEAPDGRIIFGMGALDTATALGRFRILHPGSPLRALGEIVSALRHGHGENVTFIAELVHIGTDLGSGPITMVAGALVESGLPLADHGAGWVIFFIVMGGAGVTALFAHTHTHHHHEH